ncbi:MAG: helix-turn-helix domain-containing protein, partial [Pseudonocardiaceae bacterium]
PYAPADTREGMAMMLLLREAIGERLRRTRTTQSRTLRDVSRAAQVSLGYLSEVERGRKEASSELLAAICGALDLPLDELLRRVAGDLGPVYLPEVPDMVPAELVAQSAGQDEASRRPGPDGGRLVGAAAGRAVGAPRGRQADLRIAATQAGSGGVPRAMVRAAA